MRAVRENNKTAVNYLYGRSLTPPSDSDRQRALKLAKENRRAFETGGKVNKEKCAKQIIDKLTTTGTEVEAKKEKDALPKVNSPRGEYMKFIKKMSGKPNKDKFDEMDEDLAR